MKCQYCTKRYPGCHGQCPVGIAAEQQKRERNAKRTEAFKISNALSDLRTDALASFKSNKAAVYR